MSEIKIPKVGLGVLIFDELNRLLLGERIGAHGSLTWAPPGGHLEFGESFEQGAMREVSEETGLSVSDPKFLGVTNDFFEVEDKHYISIFMTVTFPHGETIINREPHKTKEWKWFGLNDLPEPLFMPLHQFLKQNMGSYKWF